MVQFLQFALTRAAMAVVTLLTVSLIVFTLMELVPGTCAERYLAFKNTQGFGRARRRNRNLRVLGSLGNRWCNA